MKLHYYLTAIVCWLSILSYGQSVNDYLKGNSADITQEVAESAVLDAEFFNNQLFLLGESHGIARPQQIDFNFLKLLNRRAGVRTYVAEVDFAKAWYLNRYLDGGNERLLDTVFADWIKQDAQWANKDFQDKIRNIRELNKTLPANRRIHFTGIDQIQNPVLAAAYLQMLLSQKPFKPYKTQLDLLCTYLRSNAPDSVIAGEAKRLLTSLTLSTPGRLKSQNKKRLNYILANCVRLTGDREEALYQNFKSCYELEHWQNQKLYGFWGFFHILQAGANGGKSVSFVNRLINDPALPLKGKTVSIGFLYVGSRMALPTAFLPPPMQAKGKHFTISDQMNYDGPLTTFGIIENFKQVTQPNTVTLFRLTAPGSPITGQPVKITYSNFMPPNQRLQLDEPGKGMADYFQYVILVRNSPAVSTLVP